MGFFILCNKTGRASMLLSFKLLMAAAELLRMNNIHVAVDKRVENRILYVLVHASFAVWHHCDLSESIE